MSKQRISKTLEEAIDKFDEDQLKGKRRRLREAKASKAKPDLKLTLPNIYLRRVLDGEVEQIIPYEFPINAKALKRVMIHLLRQIDLKIHWLDDKEVVQKIHTNPETKPPKQFMPPSPYPKPTFGGYRPTKKKFDVPLLLQQLREATDQNEKKKLRRQLRSMGHEGGLGHVNQWSKKE